MKKFTKLLGIVLIMALVMSMGITAAFAEPVDTTLKVAPVTGHTYTAYQLFVGDLAADGTTLSNVKWGANVVGTIKIGETNYSPVAGEDVPEAVLTYVAGLTSNTKDTADILGAWVTGNGVEITDADTTVKTGYYVVKDAYTNPSDPQETTLSTTIVNIVGPTTVTPKAGTTEHKKEVLDVNDTTDVALDLSNLQNIATGWDASADHDFGDHVPFKLTTTIASDFAKYKNYYLAVNDTMYDGLKLDAESIKVYVDGELATEGTGEGEYVLTTAPQSFSVVFNKLNGNVKAAADKDVVVYYTATLDADTAVIGDPGNWNESYAEFSNNPNDDQSGTGKTPTVTAVVFTYKTVVNKIDKEKNPLKGAEFTLTKKLKNGTETTVAVIKYDEKGNVTTKTANGTATSEGDATKFSFNGLDDGTYTLTETVTPNGYNTIKPVTFKVTATHENAGKNVGKVDTLSVVNEDGTDFNGDLNFTATESKGTISTDVVNQSGTVLPSTGGIGTTIFYVVGSILVVAAGVLLITKKRMGRE